MKRPFVVALAGLLALTPAAARAQGIASLGFSAGAVVPVSDYEKNLDVGYHLTLLLAAHPPLSPLGFRAEGTYSELGYHDSGAKTSIWSFTANGTINGPGVPLVASYLIGGVGIYSSGYPGIQVGRRTNAGLNGGAGVRLGLSGFNAFAEVRYHHVLGNEGGVTITRPRIVPITFGLMF